MVKFAEQFKKIEDNINKVMFLQEIILMYLEVSTGRTREQMFALLQKKAEELKPPE